MSAITALMTRRGMKIRRIGVVQRGMLVIGLLLMAGAVINVTVAWGCAWFLPSAVRGDCAIALSSDMHPSMRYWVRCEINSGFGFVQLRVMAVHPVKPDEFWRHVSKHEDGVIVLNGPLSPLEGMRAYEPPVLNAPWSKLGVSTNRGGSRAGIEGEAAAGWPMLAMWCDMERSSPEYGSARDPWSSVALSSRLTGRAGLYGPVDRMPLRPIWPGFAINTLVYAFVIGAAWSGVGTLCRAIRRRRGLCARCAYPVGASPVCTECGAAVKFGRAHEEGSTAP